MIVVVIIVLLTVVIAVVSATVYTNKKKEKEQKYYIAAGNIYKEDYLNYSLQNPFDENLEYSKPADQKTMIYLKCLHKKNKMEYVFDPNKKIIIGRDQKKCNLFINEASVSKTHCCIFAMGFDVYLQDIGSANGTMVCKGLFNNVLISNNEMIQLESGDIIKIGSNEFKVTLFFYDVTVM